MDALEYFFRVPEFNALPACVPVVSSNGRQIGLVTAGLPFLTNPYATRLVLSEDPGERALAAIQAVEAARLRVQASGTMTTTV